MVPQHSSTRVIDSEHPSLAGHFPGHPIVPGVVILDEVMRFVEQCGYDVTTIPNSKFLRPLLPDTAFTIELTEGKSGTMRYRCLDAEGAFASGSVTVR